MKKLIVLILLSAFIAACGSSTSSSTESFTAVQQLPGYVMYDVFV
jgi:ABC-type glycerol-3-phosphate transport system substrate-binding protein